MRHAWMAGPAICGRNTSGVMIAIRWRDANTRPTPNWSRSARVSSRSSPGTLSGSRNSGSTSESGATRPAWIAARASSSPAMPALSSASASEPPARRPVSNVAAPSKPRELSAQVLDQHGERRGVGAEGLRGGLGVAERGLHARARRRDHAEAAQPESPPEIRRSNAGVEALVEAVDVRERARFHEEGGIRREERRRVDERELARRATGVRRQRVAGGRERRAGEHDRAVLQHPAARRALVARRAGGRRARRRSTPPRAGSRARGTRGAHPARRRAAAFRAATTDAPGPASRIVAVGARSRSTLDARRRAGDDELDLDPVGDALPECVERSGGGGQVVAYRQQDRHHAGDGRDVGAADPRRAHVLTSGPAKSHLPPSDTTPCSSA